MKLLGYGFITSTVSTVNEDGAKKGVVELSSDIEAGYVVLPVWGGVHVKNKAAVLSLGYATTAQNAEVLAAGDNTVVYSDGTISWDGTGTSHASLCGIAPFSVAVTSRRAVWADSESEVRELEPYKKHVVYKLEYPLPLRVSVLAVGAQFTLALGHCGIVWSWGINNHGQLGQGHIETVKEPTPIDYLGGLKVKDIAAGYWHSLAVTEFEVVYAWGWNNKGQLGLSSEKTMESEPIALFEDETEIRKVSCGRSHSAFLDSGDNLYVCGFNKYGQCNPDKSDHENLFLDNTLSDHARLAAGVSDVVCGPWSTFYVTD